MTEYTLVLIAFGFLAVALSLLTIQNARLKRELQEHHGHFEAIQQMFMVLGAKVMELDKAKDKANV